MTRNQARAMARKLHEEGLNPAEIAAKLSEHGFKSLRGDGPLKPSGVYYLMSGRRRAPAAVKSADKTEAKKTRVFGKAAAIASILKLKGMAAEERIALALLVLE
jgi:hypothetical protein